MIRVTDRAPLLGESFNEVPRCAVAGITRRFPRRFEDVGTCRMIMW